MTANEVQELADKIVKPKSCYTGYSSFAHDYHIGLCPRCGEPILLAMTNGGKLSPAKTLRACHAFTGDVRCENPATLNLIRGKSGQEKMDFFFARHDAEKIASIG